MRLLIDADGCPVVALAVAEAKARGIPCLILCDTAHEMEHPGAETVVVSKGVDSVDFALLRRLAPGDIVITQDYGLAALCLARRAWVLDQNGRAFRASWRSSAARRLILWSTTTTRRSSLPPRFPRRLCSTSPWRRTAQGHLQTKAGTGYRLPPSVAPNSGRCGKNGRKSVIFPFTDGWNICIIVFNCE